MLRQLARLTRPAAAAGPRAVAIAVYADEQDRAFAAAETGAEGIACVDDAARAVVLLSDLWRETRSPLAHAWATALLDFVLHMQDADGRFVNFVSDRSGSRNETGATSAPGGGFWQARGLRALAAAEIELGDPRAHDALVRGLPHVRAGAYPADVRAIHALTALALVRSGRMPELRADLDRWCDEIAACRRGDVLMDNPDETEPHLWGHLQEGVLAGAGALLERPDLVHAARRSALAYLAPAIASGFALPTTQPYGVACAIYGVERLSAVTGESAWTALAAKGRGWFHGRNPAGVAVYDRVAGRVHDGIDDGRLNLHSGAESNIVGAQALFAEVRSGASALASRVEASFPSTVPLGLRRAGRMERAGA